MRHRERPILMSGRNVRRILDGRKTQTRRVVKNPARLGGLMMEGEEPEWCPYGGPGGRLWVRETHAWADGLVDGYTRDPALHVAYRADNSIRTPGHSLTDLNDDNSWNLELIRWRPSIHMPRWACRLVLEVTAVRCERLREISISDVLAEGISRDDDRISDVTLVGRFRRVWDAINAKRGYSWESNPFVWVVEFERAPDLTCDT